MGIAPGLSWGDRGNVSSVSDDIRSTSFRRGNEEHGVVLGSPGPPQPHVKRSGMGTTPRVSRDPPVMGRKRGQKPRSPG